MWRPSGQCTKIWLGTFRTRQAQKALCAAKVLFCSFLGSQKESTPGPWLGHQIAGPLLKVLGYDEKKQCLSSGNGQTSATDFWAAKMDQKILVDEPKPPEQTQKHWGLVSLATKNQVFLNGAQLQKKKRNTARSAGNLLHSVKKNTLFKKKMKISAQLPLAYRSRCLLPPALILLGSLVILSVAFQTVCVQSPFTFGTCSTPITVLP